MANTNGKKARKGGGGNRYDIKRNWRRGGKEYRDNAERRKEHAEFVARQRKGGPGDG